MATTPLNINNLHEFGVQNLPCTSTVADEDVDPLLDENEVGQQLCEEDDKGVFLGSPEDLSDLVSWQDHSDATSLFKDAASNTYVTNVTTPGDLIYGAYNKVSVGNVLTYNQTGGNNTMHYASEVKNGLTASGCQLDFGLTDFLQGVNNPLGQLRGTLTQQDQITVVYVARSVNANRLNAVLSITSNDFFPASNTPCFNVYLDTRTSRYGASIMDNSGTEVYSVLPSNPATGWVVGVATKNGSAIRSRINGVWGTTVNAVGNGIVNITGEWYWNRYKGGYQGFHGNAGIQLIYDRVLTESELIALERLLAGEWGITF